MRFRHVQTRLVLPGILVFSPVLLFLAANLAAHLVVVAYLPAPVQALVLAAVSCVIFVMCRPRYLNYLVFFTSFSFPLYGVPAYQPLSLFCEFVLSLVCLLLVFEALRSTPPVGGFNINSLGLLVGGYVLLALLSLLQMPVEHAIRLASLWGLFDFSGALLQSTPGSGLYPYAAANRLVLFFLFGHLLARSRHSGSIFRALFAGLVMGMFAASGIGILEHYHMFSLEWLRPESIERGRLQSLFGNPGWFAEYVVVTVPFVFVIAAKGRAWLASVLYFLVFVCFFAVILTRSRTAWLLYPLIVALLWSTCHYFASAYKQGLLRGTVRLIGATGMYTLLFVLVAGGSFSLFHMVKGSDEGLLEQRFAKLSTIGMRGKIWQDAMAIGRESPLVGRGYESYKYQVVTLASIPESTYSRQHEKVGFLADTPHNLYLQLWVSNGVAGLAIWCMATGYMLMLLYRDFRSTGNTTSLAVFFSVIAFHLYGLTQSMQYIGVTWLLVFLCFAYAMTIDDSVLSPRGRKTGRLLLWSTGILVCLGGAAYLANYQSRALAAKYGLRIYAPDQEQSRYFGFYPRETWAKGEIYRWTGKRAVVKLDRAGVYDMKFFCNAPGMGRDPIVLDVLLDGSPIDRITFWRPRTVTGRYAVPAVSGRLTGRLELQVSRTWNPRREGISRDSRNLGVAVSEVQPESPGPGRDLGFYRWQFGKVAVEDSEARPLAYRWTHWQARIGPDEGRSRPGVMLVKNEQPFPERFPLEIRFLQNSQVIATRRLTGHGWSAIVLPAALDSRLPLVIHAGRTWNPLREGYGNDPRDLGVAVALLSAAGERRKKEEKTMTAVPRACAGWLNNL